MEVETITLSDLFLMETRKTPGGLGFSLRATGAMPRFYDQLRRQGRRDAVGIFPKIRGRSRSLNS